MATPQSHIWGSGILDPNMDCSQISPSQVHAVRGRLTYHLLKAKVGLTKAIPLGDPGIFVDEIPEVRAYRSKAVKKRRVGVIPHHRLIHHQYIRDMSDPLDVGVINPRLDCIEFIKEIISSEVIVSQSLHGIIFAQVFAKPFVWLSHSSDENWLFKFRDWFSTTDDPPSAPAMFGTELGRLLEVARTCAIDVDKRALREALPRISAEDRILGIGFREARRLSPLRVRIDSEGGDAVNSNLDAVFQCKKGDEATLQSMLHAQARQYDEIL